MKLKIKRFICKFIGHSLREVSKAEIAISVQELESNKRAIQDLPSCACGNCGTFFGFESIRHIVPGPGAVEGKRP